MISKSEYLKSKEIELEEIISSEKLKNSLNQTHAKKNGAEFNEKYSESYLWRYSLYISSRSCYLLENDKNNETAITSLKKAAEIYENLYYVSDEYDRSYSLLLSSLCYDLSGYQANAKCMIDVLLEKNLSYYSLKSEDELNNLENSFLKTIQLFLQKKIYLLDDELNRLREIDTSRLPISYENFLNDYISLLENIIEFVFEGDENLIEIIQFNSQNAYKSILYSGNVLMSHLMHLFNVRLEIFFEKNIWTNMGKYVDTHHPLWNKYIKLKTKDYYSKFEIKDKENRHTIMEFWNSQLNALNANIIGENQNNENYIIKMPTSAGKTFIAEMLLLNSLIENENSKAIYITPYLSLTNEINESLSSLEKLGFTLSNMTKTPEIDEYENLWVKEADVLIATPEKIDLLYRNEKEFFKDVSIIIMDEGHIVGDNGKRSVLTELLISKLKMNLCDTRFIFVSAMMTDTDTRYLSKWITHKENNVLESPTINGEVWEPTRRLIGYLDYKNNKGHIRYKKMDMFVPNIIQQNTYSYINPDSGRKNTKKFPKVNDTKSDIAVELAYNLISEGNILIFTSQSRLSISIGESFLYLFKLKNLVNEEINMKFKNSGELHSLNISEKLLGKDHPVTKCLEYNIGIHNGSLPEDLRKSIELDFKNKKLNVLIATNTISQGINFPIKNTLIHALNYDEGLAISKRDFWNLVGRTGRAGKETEGKIIFIAKNQNDMNRFEEYTNTITIENLTSRLLEIIQEIIVNSDLNNKYIQEEIEPILFNILIEESVDSLDESVIENTLQNSLFYVQSDPMQKECLFKCLKHSGNVFYSEITDTELRTIYSKTGLTLKSNRYISGYVLENLDEFDMLIDENDNESLLNHIFNLFPHLKEMDNSKLNNEKDEINFFTQNKDFLISITKRWIDGETVEELINSWKDYFGDDKKIHAFLNKSLQYNFSWGIHSLLEILIYHLNNEYEYEIDKIEDLPANIKNFSSYIKYGLNNPEACKCKNLGIGNRETCIKLVNEYYSAENYSNWFFNINYANLKNNPNFSNAEKKEVIQILQEKNYNQKQFEELIENPIDVPITSNELDIGSVILIERNLTDKFNLYKIDLKYEDNTIGSLPINYSKALAIEMDLNNINLLAEVIEIKEDKISIIIKNVIQI